MTKEIKSVAVLGGGTMGAGIAGLCAERDIKVLILEINQDAVDAAKDRLLNGIPAPIDNPEKMANIETGTFDKDLEKLKNYDWICEAIIENAEAKRGLIKRVEEVRSDHTILTSNTSGILLKEISEGMPDRLKKNLAVTHFFNPVKAMKLLEIVPGNDTDPETVEALNLFCTQTLEKGVVIAKDTISFIANRIGCFFMFIGLHKGKEALDRGLSQERVDAILSTPIGLPSTGLYSLYDLIGLDVMEMIGKNFAANLPEEDLGKQYGEFPEAEKEMITNGQFGRKTGGGFFRMTKNEDGSRNKETFDLLTKTWRPQKKEELDINDINILFDDSPDGVLAWDVYGTTLCYAANLVPIIADDIVSVDRAMQWGFNWSNGPFKAMDNIGPYKIIDKLEKEGIELPHMLKVLKDNNAESFYNDQGEQLSPEGNWISI